MLDFTDIQTARIDAALTSFALANGADESDLSRSRVRLGSRSGLTKHVARVERALSCSYAELSANTQNVLEAARATAGALAHTVDFHAFNALDRRVWAVVLSNR
jgi:hypothetical protein